MTRRRLKRYAVDVLGVALWFCSCDAGGCGDKNTVSFYKSAKWERVRARVLRKDEYLCRECKRYGKRSSASHVHHAWPLDQYPELAYAEECLVSLCSRCHNAMHNREDNSLTSRGEELRIRNPPHPKDLTS